MLWPLAWGLAIAAIAFVVCGEQYRLSRLDGLSETFVDKFKEQAAYTLIVATVAFALGLFYFFTAPGWGYLCKYLRAAR